MAWSYSGDPSSSTKDAVRYIVGDTQEDEAFVTDEEIEWALSENPNMYAAASVVALNLSTYFATQAQQVKVGPLVEIFNNRAIFYANAAKTLEQKAAKSSGIIAFAGGIADRGPNFSIGMHDFSTSDPSLG